MSRPLRWALQILAVGLEEIRLRIMLKSNFHGSARTSAGEVVYFVESAPMTIACRWSTMGCVDSIHECPYDS